MTKAKTENILFYIILFLAAFVRLYKLSEIPLGLNQDEAYSGYEAFSLLTTGHDSWGYRFPVYFIAWASGMNALYAYLTIPFFSLLGVNIWALRLPQALLGTLSCYIFYRLLRLMFNKPTALLGFALASFTPWHLILSRWGLESNLAPFFILTGFYFFARSIKNKDYLLLSAVFYGLSLYAYATTWIYTILTFGLQLLYFLLCKDRKKVLFTVLSAGMIFTLFALPLLCFILINNDLIAPINTRWFSIPKLLVYRSKEIGFNDLGTKMPAFLRVFITGDDFLITNRILPYGTLFPISLPFIFLGFYDLGKKALQDIRFGRCSLSAVILGSVTIGIIYGLTLYSCINRLNFLWFNLLLLLLAGIQSLKHFQKLHKGILLIYLGFIMAFINSYFNQYNTLNSGNFTPYLKPSIELAEKYHQRTGLPITFLEQEFIYPKVLFYTQTSPEEFQKTVVWKNFIDAYRDTFSFTHFRFNQHPDYAHIPTNSIYIVPFELQYFFYKFDTKVVGNYLVAIPKQTNHPL